MFHSSQEEKCACNSAGNRHFFTIRILRRLRVLYALGAGAPELTVNSFKSKLRAVARLLDCTRRWPAFVATPGCDHQKSSQVKSSVFQNSFFLFATRGSHIIRAVGGVLSRPLEKKNQTVKQLCGFLTPPQQCSSRILACVTQM